MTTVDQGVQREAIIDTDAVTHNVRHIRQAAGVDVIAVVKANAYGHGVETLAHTAIEAGANRLGVADLAEAIHLREVGVAAPILAWLHAPDVSFTPAGYYNIELGLSRAEQLAQAATAATAEPLAIHLKLETGLGRNGAGPDAWPTLFADAARHEAAGRIRVIGLFTHLSGTSVAEDAASVAMFESAIAAAREAGLTPPLLHAASTAAALTMPEARFSAVRVGLGIYGLSPFADRSSADLGLRPAMTLRAPVVATRRVDAGQGVSYGYDYRTATPTTLALVPLGYADGIPRQASGIGPVQIGDARFTVAGRVAMDQFVVDVGDHPVRVGDTVTVFGDPATGVPSADDWAQAAGTINYDIVTGIGPRVTRRDIGR